MVQSLGRHLPLLGVEACTVTRLSTTPAGVREHRVLTRLGEKIVSSSSTVLTAESLGIDSSLDHRAAVVVLPLDFGGQSVGLASCSWGAHNPLNYELLRELIGAAVYGCKS